MTARRLVVHIGEVIVDAPHGADLAALEAEVRAGIAAAFTGDRPPPAFAHSAPRLETVHAGVPGLGAAIAGAAPPERAS
jgi:hypothetical protein